MKSGTASHQNAYTLLLQRNFNRPPRSGKSSVVWLQKHSQQARILPLKQNIGSALLTKFIATRLFFYYVFSIFIDFATFVFCSPFNLYFRKSAFPILTGGGALRFLAEKTNAHILMIVFPFLFFPLEPVTPFAEMFQATTNNLYQVTYKMQIIFKPWNKKSSMIGRVCYSSVPGTVWSPLYG